MSIDEKSIKSRNKKIPKININNNIQNISQKNLFKFVNKKIPQERRLTKQLTINLNLNLNFIATSTRENTVISDTPNGSKRQEKISSLKIASSRTPINYKQLNSIPENFDANFLNTVLYNNNNNTIDLNFFRKYIIQIVKTFKIKYRSFKTCISIIEFVKQLENLISRFSLIIYII